MQTTKVCSTLIRLSSTLTFPSQVNQTAFLQMTACNPIRMHHTREPFSAFPVQMMSLKSKENKKNLTTKNQSCIPKNNSQNGV